jgi:hypothetical protein
MYGPQHYHNKFQMRMGALLIMELSVNMYPKTPYPPTPSAVGVWSGTAQHRE